MSIFKQIEDKINVQTHIKDFVIERMEKGESPKKIKDNIKRLYDVDVSLMFITRTRKQYMRITGEYLKTYKEFHKIKFTRRKK